MRKIKLISLFALTIVLNSCFKMDNTPNINYLMSEFSNYSWAEININSTSNSKEYVSIFFDEAYTEDGALKEPYLSATTPINSILKVPSHVKKLVVVKNGEIMELPTGNITLSKGETQTIADTKTSANTFKEIVDQVNNVYFPERKHNIKRDNIYKCTDLTIKDDLSDSEFKEAEVFITYLSDGFFSQSWMYGKLWAYSYPREKRNTLSTDDCTFYGWENGAIVELSYDQIKEIKNGDDKENPLFWSFKEQQNIKEGIYTERKIGTFKKGESIGFVFKGDKERCQFTTPALNKSEGQNNSYMGYTINYNDGEAPFTIDKNISNGFIYSIDVEGQAINILGMENRTPAYKAYDGDYNDMLCYVRSTPIVLETEEELVRPEIGGDNNYTRTKGLYLFEDNYPHRGDFDFNDVVISYEIFDYFKTSNKKKMIVVQSLATGAERVNDFGFAVNNNDNKVIIKNLTGKKNVFKTDFSKDNYSGIFVETLYGDIKPFLYNGTEIVYDNNFNNGEYPYVLDIPSTGGADEYFRWCIEGNRIDSVYDFKAPRAADWYATPVHKDLVIDKK